MQAINCIQQSPEWFAAKCGIPSASNFHSIITSKGTPSKQREKYLFKLAGETITGLQEESYQSAAMLRGQEMEAEARQLYCLLSNEEVKEVGFCLAEGFGASPDALVGEKGLLEIKCPTMAVHISYLIKGILPIDYFQQVQGQLLVTDRAWVDFMSYYPGLKPFVFRVRRDNKFIELLAKELKIFCQNLKVVVGEIR